MFLRRKKKDHESRLNHSGWNAGIGSLRFTALYGIRSYPNHRIWMGAMVKVFPMVKSIIQCEKQDGFSWLINVKNIVFVYVNIKVESQWNS